MKKNKVLIAAGSLGLVSLAYLTLKKKNYSDVPVVTPFDVNRYLGHWYEIARIDFKWEKNLNNTSARYTLNSDGTIHVINQGWHEKKQEWQTSVGKAKIRKKNTGALKVSFFGPFYDEYNVVEITPDYNHALIFGKNTDYMWILSREKTVPEKVLQLFLLKAESFGYDIDDLVWPDQD